MTTYSIGNNRSLKFAKKNNEFCIRDKGTKKSAVFTPARWASFLLCLNAIDSQLQKLSQDEDVAYRNHYGGGWHVSVTKGFRCIDLRKFFVPTGETTCKPTMTGIALRLDEWPVLKEAINNLVQDNPSLVNFLPCFYNKDHSDRQVVAGCKECNPFSLTIV